MKNHKKIAKIIYEIVLTSITISGNIHRIKVAYAENSYFLVTFRSA
jgi:hypothetical protein